MPVRVVLGSLSSTEIAEWMAYYQLEPWGEARADLRIGQLSAMVYNMTRPKGKREAKWQDFAYQRRRRATTDDVRDVFRMIAAVQGEAPSGKRR